MKDNRWKTIIIVIAGLFAISWFASLFFSGDYAESGNVAVIPVTGVIVSHDTRGFRDDTADASSIVGFIKDADEDPAIKAIMLRINSPGGAPVPSSMIADAVANTNKTTIAVIQDLGASGAYWVASAADVVYVHPLSITGSVGVISSYIQWSGLMAKYGVTYERIVAGEYKDIGSPYRDLEDNERLVLQAITDKMHDHFLRSVASYRDLDDEAIAEVSKASIMIGEDAIRLGLADNLGTEEDALRYVEDALNITATPIVYQKESSFWDVLSSIASEQSFWVGKGIGNELMSLGYSGLMSIRT